jgi:polar amino acid transport system permease protein
MRYNINYSAVLSSWQSFLDGMLVTIAISLIMMAVSLVIGVACAAARIWGPKYLRWAVTWYVDINRNTPLLVILYLIFFGLPAIGVRFNSFEAAIAALVINLAAYTSEIVRAGFESIPKSQTEAGVSLGLSGWQNFRYVVLFPAFERMFPALANQYVLAMLGTAAISQIGVSELFYSGSVIQSMIFRDFEVYTVIGALYLFLAVMFRASFALAHLLLFRRAR